MTKILNKIKNTSSTKEKVEIAVKEFTNFHHEFMETCFNDDVIGISEKGIAKSIGYDKKKHGALEDLGEFFEKYNINNTSLLDFVESSYPSIKEFVNILKNYSGNKQIEIFKKYILQVPNELRPWYIRAVLKNPRIGMSFKLYNKVRKKQGLAPLEKFYVKLAKALDINEIEKLQLPLCCELKYDGLRCIAKVDNGIVKLTSRNGKDITNQFPEIEAELVLFGIENKLDKFILDGEIISKDFNTLQHRIGRKQENINEDDSIKFIVFDILKINDNDIKHLNLKQRKPILDTLTYTPKIDLGEYIYIDDYKEIKIYFNTKTKIENQEGIMIKTLDSIYDNSRDNWYKIKPVLDADLKIIGAEFGSGRKKEYIAVLYLEDENGRKTKVGSGITDDDMIELTKLYNENKLIGMTCEIQYSELTKDSYRFPRFIRLRYDK